MNETPDSQIPQATKALSASEIRSRFLEFFRKRGHVVLPSASLVTSDLKGLTNPTLFNTAGMQPLIPYLLGKPHPAGQRLVDVQKCLRTVDIDDVGDATHATFFEMLGNWSLGDYFKKEAIGWSHEFLTNPTEGLGLDPSRLYVSIFEGDANAPRDDEAADIWREIFTKNGVPVGDTSRNNEAPSTSSGQAARIFFLGADKNWWEAGDSGPAGPDTEMYYDVANTYDGKALTLEQFKKADMAGEIVEIWNDVFMQYEKKDGKIVGPLPKPSVDTGAGLERLAMTLQGVKSIYDTDLLKPVMDLMAKAPNDIHNKRIIADHLRASVFLISDGVIPSNTDRGYILRRLIRRAIINTTDKKLDEKRISVFVDTIINTYKEAYPELGDKKETIKSVMNEEAGKFAPILLNGIKEFNRAAEDITPSSSGKRIVSGALATTLATSIGLPINMITELAREKGMDVDLKGFDEGFKKHQSLSRTGAAQKFKGGLANTEDPMIIRYHTATHLLHQALHDVLGEGVEQKGSNITAERLRFDFSYGAKMTDEQKREVERIVNEKMTAALPVNKVVMSKAEAEKTGARHFFGEKYGDEVSIYFIGDTLASAYSKEFCGGPHVKNTKELAGPDGIWKFKIAKEEAISQGIRRIRAVIE